jgi:type II secretory pathway component GspD/PulD (secretin)
VIEQHFNDDAGAAVRVVPEQVSNTLLISASPAAMEEVLAVLKQLDKAPAMITIEVLVVDLDSTPSTEPADRGPTAKSGDLFDGLTGPQAEVLGKVRRMQAGGELDVLHRVRLSVLENQNAFVQQGQRKPRTQGITRSQFGTSRNVVDVNVGMIVGATPRKSPDGSIVTELNFEKSHMPSRPDDTVISEAPGGESVRQPGIVSVTCKSTLHIPPNQAVVLGDLHTTGKQESQMLLIVTADSQ